MIDKYQELRDKGLVASGQVTILITTGTPGNEVVWMSYNEYDRDTGTLKGPRSLSMTKLEMESTITAYKKRHQAGMQLYQAAFGKPPPD